MELSYVEQRHHGHIIARYREARHWSQQRLADELSVDLRTVQRMEQRPMIKSLRRRQFLIELLGIPAALLALESDKSRSDFVSLLLNEDPMAYLENALRLRLQTQQIGGPGSSSQGLSLWMSEVTHFVGIAQGSGWQTRALAVLSMSYGLKGKIARSLYLDYNAAHESLQQAYQIAQELADPELQALTLYDIGNTYIHANKPSEAITELQGALTAISGHSYPYLRGHILKLLSEAYARAQQPQNCWRSMGLAESTLAQLTSQPERSLFMHREFSQASLTAQTGADAAFLHEYERAIRLIDKGLIHTRPTFVPTRARLTIGKAEAYFGLADIGSSVFYAEEALIMARSTGSNQIIGRVKRLHGELVQSKWKNEQGVARLGALLATC